MTLHGVDVYVWAADAREAPRKIGPFDLTLVSDRGTRVYPPPAPELELSNWPRCRYVSDAEVTDAQVDDMVAELSRLGWRWTKCQKLYRQDGADMFSQPY